MKTLYLPIHAIGTYWERSRANKRGLRDALATQGDCREIDYLSITPADLHGVLYAEIVAFQPDLLFTQIQGADPLTADRLARLRADFPALRIANWNGDVWDDHLTSPGMLDILRHVDVQLTVNASVLPTYAQHGIRAAYCPFGYEAPVTALPDVPAYDVLFLGNNYSAERQRLYETLRSLPCSVGVYGAGWAQSEGECNHDFATAEALYKRARIAVSDNQFSEARGYLSDRPIQVMGAGGALLLQQNVKGLEALTGLRVGEHYMPYDATDNLPGIIEKWLRPQKENDRVGMVDRAKAFVLSEHTWGRRVEQLVTEWLPELGRVRA